MSAPARSRGSFGDRVEHAIEERADAELEIGRMPIAPGAMLARTSSKLGHGTSSAPAAETLEVAWRAAASENVPGGPR